MAKKKQSAIRSNGTDPVVPVPAGLEEEVWETTVPASGKLDPQQQSWVADEEGEPQAWSSQPEETGQVIPPDEGEALATADADVQTLDDWAAQTQTDASEEEEEEGGWGTTISVSENELLNFEVHSGVFNKDSFKMLIYGETGTQKTRTAATFPGVIFVDVDHGMSSVDRQVTKQYVPDDESGFRVLQAIYNRLARGGHDFDTVVLDTLNEMQRVIMRFTVEEFTHIRRSYGNLPGQSDYGKMLYEFMELTRAYISLPMKVVLLAQVNSQQFDTDIVGPQLVGKNTARELERKMDIIGYIYKAEAEEGTQPEITFDSPIHVTKDRSNRLPTALPNPTYSRIAAYWK